MYKLKVILYHFMWVREWQIPRLDIKVALHFNSWNWTNMQVRLWEGQFPIAFWIYIYSVHFSSLWVWLPDCRTLFIAYFAYFEQEVLGDVMTFFPLIRHGPHTKRHVQRFFYYVCINCRGNVFAKSLPNNDWDTHTDTQTDGRDLWSSPLKCAQVSLYTYQVSLKLIKAFKS
jgi:hypothetical protein